MSVITITRKKRGEPTVTRVVESDAIRLDQIAAARELEKPKPEPTPPKPKGEQHPGALLRSVAGSLRAAAEREKFLSDEERVALNNLAEIFATRAQGIREMSEVFS